MISTLHTFDRDLKWNPHIHALVPELIYCPDKNETKVFHHFDFSKLRNYHLSDEMTDQEGDREYILFYLEITDKRGSESS